MKKTCMETVWEGCTSTYNTMGVHLDAVFSKNSIKSSLCCSTVFTRRHEKFHLAAANLADVEVKAFVLCEDSLKFLITFFNIVYRHI